MMIKLMILDIQLDIVSRSEVVEVMKIANQDINQDIVSRLMEINI
jgi:hypothetical protein